MIDDGTNEREGEAPRARRADTEERDHSGVGEDSEPAPPRSPPPPRGPSVRLLVFGLLVAALAYGVGHIWGGPIAKGLSRMWASIRSEDPEGVSPSKETKYYTCGMHPWVILPKPGTCPICRMDLTPLDPSKFTGEITIDPRIVQNIGVRVGDVIEGPLVKTIRTVGSVDYDERRIRDVNIKVRGWIETLHVDYLGAEVEKGEPRARAVELRRRQAAFWGEPAART